MVKVSIIVPVYKAEGYISKCVESLMGQSLKEIEIILVDDGSPDNSGKICDEYAKSDNRIKVIHKQNGGVSTARNAGIEKSQGDYILFVDSDDWVETDYAESLWNAKKSHPDCEVLCGLKTVSDYEGTLISNVVFSENDEEIVPFKRYMELMNKWLAQSPCNKLYNNDIIKKNNIRFLESLSLGEDAIFNIEYYKVCGLDKAVVINKPLYNYIRDGKESLDNKYYHNLIEIDKMLYNSLKEFVLSYGADEYQMEILSNSIFYRYVNALSNTYRKDNPASSKEKRKTNQKILHSREFKDALNNVKSYIHPIHKIAYKSGSWFLVRTAYKITSLKKIFKR